MDLLGLVRRRPIIAVGAGVVGLVAVRYLAGDSEPGEDAADEGGSDGYGLGYGSGSTGGAGTIGYDYPTVPTNGELADSGVITTPDPAPAPSPTPATTYLLATWRAGTVYTYGWGKGNCSDRQGDFRTGGFSAEVRKLGTYKQCDGTGSRSVYAILTGAHAGRIVNRGQMATLSTKTR